MTADELWTVEEVWWSEEDARYYRVWKQAEPDDDNTAIIRRHGDIGEKLTCERCHVTEDTAFRCVHIEAVKKQEFLDYDE